MLPKSFPKYLYQLHYYQQCKNVPVVPIITNIWHYHSHRHMDGGTILGFILIYLMVYNIEYLSHTHMLIADLDIFLCECLFKPLPIFFKKELLFFKIIL